MCLNDRIEMADLEPHWLRSWSIQEVRDLLTPNPQRDLQRLCALHPLAKARVETGNSLLDEPEVERCGIGYCLIV